MNFKRVHILEKFASVSQTSSHIDQVVRAMTDDGSFRVIVANTSDTCREVCRRQKVHGETASLLSQLITGTVLVRETMAPWLRAQAIAVGSEREGRLIADAYPDGSNRGLVQRNESGTFNFGGGALLQVMRGLTNGKTHEGIIDMEGVKDISEALMNYMQHSEQINCVINVDVSQKKGTIEQSGGYIVQLLPEATRPAHMIMTERLHTFPTMTDIFKQNTPWLTSLLDEILYGMPYTVLEKSDLRFQCQCSQARVLTSLASLDRETIRDLISVNNVLEIECDYCGETYQIFAEKLRSLLSEN